MAGNTSFKFINMLLSTPQMPVASLETLGHWGLSKKIWSPSDFCLDIQTFVLPLQNPQPLDELEKKCIVLR